MMPTPAMEMGAGADALKRVGVVDDDEDNDGLMVAGLANDEKAASSSV